MTATERVHDRLDELSCRPRGTAAFCPSCETEGHHKTKSFSFTTGNKDNVVVNCHKGCSTDQILTALNMDAADLFDEPLKHETPYIPSWNPSRIIATYSYTDAEGTVLYEAVRKEPKEFRQRLADGTWKGPTNDQKVLYRLPEVVAGVADDRHVIIVEGEKDADRLTSVGLVATTSIGGAGKWMDQYADSLAGAKVVVIPDNDSAGRQHAIDIIRSLLGRAAEVKVLELPDLPPKGDVSDWLDNGHTVEELQKLAIDAPALDAVPTFDTEANEPEPADTPPKLEFLTFADLAAQVDAEGPRQWLLRGLWPHGDYGVHHAAQKAQKSWNTISLAVAVASGTPWLGHVQVDTPGPVIIFWGEGGRGNIVRRIRACAAAAGVTAEDLPITVCTRAPHLSDVEHLAEMHQAISDIKPALVIIDPLYLAARGAKLGDIYAMGEMLEGPQRICQHAGASLWVVHHDNRGDGKGSAKASGAGPAEWGRVIVSATVVARSVDVATRKTTVITTLDIVGGEVPDTSLRVTRKVWAADPDDLSSVLHVQTEVTDADEPTPAGDLKPAEAKLLAALQAADGPQTSSQLVDWIADQHGFGLKRETASRGLNRLADLGLADALDGPHGTPKQWFVDPGQRGVTSRDDHTDHTPVTSRDDHTHDGGCDGCDLSRREITPSPITPSAPENSQTQDHTPQQLYDNHGQWNGGAV